MSAPEVRVEHSDVFGKWVVYLPDARTVGVYETQAEAEEAATIERARIAEVIRRKNL